MSKISNNTNSKGFLILSAANILSKVMSLIYIPFLIATIHDEGYGIYYAAYNVYALVFTLAISGTSTVIPKLIAEYRATNHEKDAQAAFNIGRLMLLFSGVFSSTMFFLLSKPIVSFIGYEKSLYAILMLCPAIILTSTNSAYRSYFQGSNNLKPLAISQFVEQVGNTIFTVLCSYLLIKISLEWGVAGGALGTGIGALFSLVFLLFAYKKDSAKRKQALTTSQPRKTTNKELFIYMVKYSIPLILSTGLIYFGNNLIDVANIKNGLLQAGFSETTATIRYGNFGNFMQLVNVPLIIISSLSITIVPIIAKANVSDDKTELKNSISQVFKIGFLIAIPCAFGLSILSEPIFDLIFVSSTSKGSDILKIGSFIVLTSGLFQLSNTILNSIGKVYQGTFSALIGVALKISSNFLLIPIASINIYGAVIGLALSHIIPFFINVYHIKKHTGVKENIITSWINPLISSIVMSIGVYAIYTLINTPLNTIIGSYVANLISVAIAVYSGVLIYIHMLIKTQGVTMNDIDMIPSKFHKFLLIRKKTLVSA